MGNKLNKISIKKIKNFFLSLISFDTPQAIVISLSFILLILFILPYSKLSYLPPHSLYGDLIIPNFECPDSGILRNCGFYSIGETRALSLLLHFRFKEAYRMNPLAFPLFFAMLAVLIINLIRVFKKFSLLHAKNDL